MESCKISIKTPPFISNLFIHVQNPRGPEHMRRNKVSFFLIDKSNFSRRLVLGRGMIVRPTSMRSVINIFNLSLNRMLYDVIIEETHQITMI